MLQKIKSSGFVRRALYALLINHKASRKYRTIQKQLFFDAGKNFNLFFSRYADIEPQIRKNITGFAKQDSLVFDIGANIGYYTVYLSCLCDKGKIVAVEPDKGNIEYLKENMERNNCSNVVIVDKALSDHSGSSKLYVDKSTGRTSSLERNSWHPNFIEITEETISTLTLDDLTELYGVPSIIKCDVEGHELSVLNGAAETLKHKPVLFLEVIKNNREAVQSLLEKYGYRFYNAEEPFNIKRPLQEITVSNLICI